jgi:Signal transduction histidine kinase
VRCGFSSFNVQSVPTARSLRRMRFYRPRSILQLVLLGFIVVSLPLIIAIIISTYYVDRLADQSQRAVYNAVRATQGSQILTDLITAMERNARQHQVLGDSTLFEGYLQNREKFRQTVSKLSDLNLTHYQRQLLEQLAEREEGLFAALRARPPSSEQAAADFVSLTQLAHSILAESGLLVEREVEAMQSLAVKAQQRLAIQTFAVIPAALILVILFTFLIARPVRQIGHAIRRLGDWKLSPAIVVTGPRDLEALGARLEGLRRRLIDLETEKNKFLRHISHELKTPLTSIREGAELLMDGVLGELDADRQDVVNILRENSIQLQKLIEALLNFNIQNTGPEGLSLHPVDLRVLVDRVLTDHRLSIVAKELKLKRDISSLVTTVDTSKLRVVIDNLVSNAIKYAPQGGWIRITLRRERANAVLEVWDSGPGVDPSDRDRIFEPFYQGKACSNGHVKGTGIGLSVARECIKAHNGTIELVEGKFSGAQFRVTLPVRMAEKVQ